VKKIQGYNTFIGSSACLSLIISLVGMVFIRNESRFVALLLKQEMYARQNRLPLGGSGF